MRKSHRMEESSESPEGVLKSKLRFSTGWEEKPRGERDREGDGSFRGGQIWEGTWGVKEGQWK